MAFDDVQFPVDVSYGSRGGPTYRTDVIVLENGQELRAALSDQPTYVYDVAYGVKSRTQMLAVHNFFHGRKGMARTFRFKDWLDYLASDSPLIVLGERTIQLTKRYVSGAQTLDREIHKPIAPITMRRNAVPFVGFSLDANSGIITLTPDATSTIAAGSNLAINSITNANPGVLETVAVHGLTTGQQVRATGAGGMTEINGVDLNVTVLTTTTFEVGLNTTAFGTYTSGGNVKEVGISRANPALVRSVAHGFSSSDVLFIRSVLGMVEVNDLPFVVTVIDADHFTIPIDSSLYTLYASAGTVEKHVQPAETLDWSGEYDIRARFGADAIPATLEAWDIGNVSPLPIIEVMND